MEGQGQRMIKRVAVIGGGITGMGAAYELVKAGVSVCLYEKDEKLGGHAKTVTVDGVDLDLAFMVFNRVTYPNMMKLFEGLGVEMEDSDMSFSVSLDKGLGCEWGSRNGLSSLFSQKSNLLNPHFWKMLREIVKFRDDVLIYLDELENNPEMDRGETLGHFVNSRGYSDLFQRAYLIPLCASTWSCSLEQAIAFPAFLILSCLRNHSMLQIFGRPQWLTVKGRSHCYVKKLMKELVDRGCQIRTNCEVLSVSTTNEVCMVSLGDGSEVAYDGCIMAIHAPDALTMLGQQATHDERRILGAFQYAYSDIFLHRDISLMPQNPTAWSAWNFIGNSKSKVLSITFWLNVLQNIEEGHQPFLATVNPHAVPENVLFKWSAAHPVPSIAASKALSEMNNIQGKRGIWFCGAYQGYGFHEDGLKGGLVAANGILGRNYVLLRNPKQMIPSWIDTAARALVCRHLTRTISQGSLIILEDGGRVFSFQGTSEKCAPKVTIRVHNPQFYWKVSTKSDLGLADAYVNGDFSLVDEKEGLLNLFMILLANRESESSASKHTSKRGWWTPMLLTSGINSAKYFYSYFSREVKPTEAHESNFLHGDLSKGIFPLFLDETMTFSCAVFKSVKEDLKDAQLRKIYLLIKKARIEKNHEILEIGCGWGSLAIEVVKHTGCKYTGITLSEEQLRFATERVKKAGLQDRIKFLLCDFRELPDVKKYDRIISCETSEALRHEYVEDFFHCCDSVLTNNGLLVLQFIALPYERYDQNEQSLDFVKEYIFPGLPSFNRVTSAMANASRLRVEHTEDIGIHYYQTLQSWRRNFFEKQREIMSLGFDEKFIRTWAYHFDYCAAGFKSRNLGNYQVVFSRPGNVTALSNPYEDAPSFSYDLMEDPLISST